MPRNQKNETLKTTKITPKKRPTSNSPKKNSRNKCAKLDDRKLTQSADQLPNDSNPVAPPLLVSYPRIVNAHRTDEQRHLDYLAAFLNGSNGICSAISLVNNEIIVTANALQSNANLKRNDQLFWIKKVLHYFLQCAQGTSQQEEKINILVKLIENKVNSNLQKAPTAKNRLAPGVNKLKDIVIFFLDQPAYLEDWTAYLHKIADPDNSKDRRVKSYKRLYTAITQLSDYATEAIRQFNSVEVLFMKNPTFTSYRIVCMGGRDVHAEVRLFYYLAMMGHFSWLPKESSTIELLPEENTPLDLQPKNEPYLGISLLCCRDCWGFFKFYYKEILGVEWGGTCPKNLAGTHGIHFSAWNNPAHEFSRGLDLGKYLKVSVDGVEEEKGIQVDHSIKEEWSEFLARLSDFTGCTEAPTTPPPGAKKDHIKMSNSPEIYSPFKIPLEHADKLEWSDTPNKRILRNGLGQEVPCDWGYVGKYIAEHQGNFPPPNDPRVLPVIQPLVNLPPAEPTVARQPESVAGLASLFYEHGEKCGFKVHEEEGTGKSSVAPVTTSGIGIFGGLNRNSAQRALLSLFNEERPSILDTQSAVIQATIIPSA